MANHRDQRSGTDEELEKEIELLKQGGWGEKLGHWLRQNFVGLVLPLIAIVVLLIGIFFYSSGGLEIGSLTAGPSQEKTSDEQQPAGTGGPEVAADQNQTTQPVAQPETPTQEITTTQDSLTLSAQPGDGITHLARQALAQYLLELEDQAPQLSPEHLIYAEDFVQNQIGDFGLEIGQELTFSKALLQQAIDASLGLSQSQLNNLKQFSQLVPSLQTNLN
jgi:hypothetical protein